MRRARVAIAGLLLLPAAASADGMLDPLTDGLFEPFSYLAKPCTILGGIGADSVTQITWDGALYTGAVELLIVTGDPPRPVAPRVKELGGGYVPFVRYPWLDDQARYTTTAFAGVVDGVGPVNFVRLRAQRTGEEADGGGIGFALRHSGLDQRAAALKGAPFDPSVKYELSRDMALIGDQVVCMIPQAKPSRRFAVPDNPYKKPFTGESMSVEPHTATLLCLWDFGREGEVTVDLKMPWRPVPRQSKAALNALKAADPEEQAALVVEGWQAELGKGMGFEVAEIKPVAAYHANVAYALMAVQAPDEGTPRLRHRLRNRDLSPTEAAAVIGALDSSGRHTMARTCLAHWLEAQAEDGCLTPDADIGGHAALLSCVASHAWLTGDREWTEAVYPHVQRAAHWLGSKVLLPDTPQASRARAFPGVSAATEIAVLLGHEEDVRTFQVRWEQAAMALGDELGNGAAGAELLPTVLSAIRGLPDALPPPMADPWEEPYTELCWRLHEQSAEGLVVEDGVLSPLATARLAQLHAARGEQREAVRLLYSLLVHTGASHEGFSRGVAPWSDRDLGEALTPDAMFSAAYITAFREMLVREQGDELHLFSAVPPEWLRPGDTLGIDATTQFGPVSAVLQAEEGGARLGLVAPWHAAPTNVVLHLPYFVTMTQVDSDYPGLVRREGPKPVVYPSAFWEAAPDPKPYMYIEFPANTTEVSIKWELDESEQLSYETTLERWKSLYATAFDISVAHGHAPLSLEPISLQ